MPVTSPIRWAGFNDVEARFNLASFQSKWPPNEFNNVCRQAYSIKKLPNKLLKFDKLFRQANSIKMVG